MFIDKPLPMSDAKFRISSFPGCCGSLEFFDVDENCVAITATWCITKTGNYDLCAGVLLPFHEPELFIPAVLYRRNASGEGAFPKGGIEKRFSFREDRTPLPGCVMLYERNYYAAFCLAPAHDAHFLASVQSRVENDSGVIEMRVPPHESPFSYRGKTRVAKEEPSLFSATDCTEANPLVVRRACFVYVQTVESCDANTLFETYRRFAQTVTRHEKFINLESDARNTNQNAAFTKNSRGIDAPQTTLSWNEWFSLKLRHLEFLTERQADGTAYIRMGKGNGDLQHIYDFTGASFLVKSVEGALVFAKSGRAALAESIGRFFLRAESAPGVYRDNYSIARDEWGGYLGVSENSEYAHLINSRCNGEAMLSYIKLYETLAAQNIVVQEFIDLPKRVAAFYLENQIRDERSEWCGCFGRWWATDGKPVNMRGTNGAYIVNFLIALLPHADKTLKSKIDGALSLAAQYYHRMITNADWYGDTIDADAVDKEAGAALLRESFDMYALTGNAQFLDDAKKAASFVHTWMWQYDVLFPDGTPLAVERFKTHGMTSVSVAHHHLDFYGMYLARDFLRLYKACGDKFYYEAARLMLRPCRALVATTQNPLGKNADFAGWQPEQINHTAWDYFDRPDHEQGHYGICIAWVTVLALGAYLQIRDECPEALENGAS